MTRRDHMTPEARELLAEILEGTAPLTGTLCADWPLVYEATTNGTDPETQDYAVTTALRLCKSCPAMAGCSAWYDTLPLGARPPGVIAGRISERTADPQRNLTGRGRPAAALSADDTTGATALFVALEKQLRRTRLLRHRPTLRRPGTRPRTVNTTTP
jgi:hypothetical protein